MRRIRLIHWNAEEAKARASKLREAGYRVQHAEVTQDVLRMIRNSPPDVVVIDLARLPSHGRDVGMHLRETRSTRGVPLVFVEGTPDKVARVRKSLPDAVYTTWRRIRSALKEALAHPPENPVVPRSRMDAYASTPLPKKLGIKPNATVALLAAPDGFEKALGKLPEGVKLRTQARGRPDMVVWFTRNRRELEGRIDKVGKLPGRDGLWIAWPKKASGMETDLTQAIVRKAGLAAGLVDYKICSIDATWSGLRFTRRGN